MIDQVDKCLMAACARSLTDHSVIKWDDGRASRLVTPGDLLAEHRLDRENGDGRWGLTTEEMRAYWDAYAPGASPDDPLVYPLHADLRGLPPTCVLGAALAAYATTAAC